MRDIRYKVTPRTPEALKLAQVLQPERHTAVLFTAAGRAGQDGLRAIGLLGAADHHLAVEIGAAGQAVLSQGIQLDRTRGHNQRLPDGGRGRK